ncbi:MAG: hypothetical protein Roseis2KO_59640 [Roseivirga sp.]
MRVIVATGLLAMMLLLISVIIMIASGSGKSRQTITAIISCLASGLILGTYSVFNFVNEIDEFIPKTPGMRSGKEIYEYYFGKPRHRCLRMIEHTDLQASAKGDWLHFKTCPEEFDRIARQYRFEVAIDTNNNEWFDKPVPDNDWFKPDELGEGRQKFSFPAEPKPRLLIYTNNDSTEVFMVSYN